MRKLPTPSPIFQLWGRSLFLGNRLLLSLSKKPQWFVEKLELVHDAKLRLKTRSELPEKLVGLRVLE